MVVERAWLLNVSSSPGTPQLCGVQTGAIISNQCFLIYSPRGRHRANRCPPRSRTGISLLPFLCGLCAVQTLGKGRLWRPSAAGESRKFNLLRDHNSAFYDCNMSRTLAFAEKLNTFSQDINRPPAQRTALASLDFQQPLLSGDGPGKLNFALIMIEHYLSPRAQWPPPNIKQIKS